MTEFSVLDNGVDLIAHCSLSIFMEHTKFYVFLGSIVKCSVSSFFFKTAENRMFDMSYIHTIKSTN